MDVDVAIIGGGPAGSTLGTLIKKYRPSTEVVILEREEFPREHVGESQLPLVSQVLHEMGVWDKVEAAGYPIKVGATYRWGTSEDLWDFEFIPGESLSETARPGKYQGQRQKTAFQVERSSYDKILLDHAEEAGCEVLQPVAVKQVEKDGDAVSDLTLSNGESLKAKYYVDATGNSALLRRAMGVEVDEPSKLKNVAFWDYWDDAEWAIELADEATRVNVMSLGYGWLWFIPLGKKRASVGLVIPAEKFKEQGLPPEETYLKAIQSEKTISHFLRDAKREGPVRGTKDWSFVSRRMAGPNWFLVGEAAGFADPHFGSWTDIDPRCRERIGMRSQLSS